MRQTTGDSFLHFFLPTSLSFPSRKSLSSLLRENNWSLQWQPAHDRAHLSPQHTHTHIHTLTNFNLHFLCPKQLGWLAARGLPWVSLPLLLLHYLFHSLIHLHRWMDLSGVLVCCTHVFFLICLCCFLLLLLWITDEL